MDNEIDIEEVAEKYNKIDVIWNEKDKWHLKTKKMINDFVLNSLKSIQKLNNPKILNAGSAGYSYGINEKDILHIDIAKDRISHLSNAIVADIQNIPTLPNKFDLIICVGSVINYCDPIKVIEEFKRNLNDDGYIILEFENSYTFELLGKTTFNKKAVFIKTFYNGAQEKIWFFSESYIRNLVDLAGFKVIKLKRCHLLSPLIYRFYANENFAAYFAKLDELFSFIPFIKQFSSNTIFLLVKNK